jgi:hypothetical protein
MATYYLLKVKGKARIPDYIQVRDANFTLIGYFRPGRGEKLNSPELSAQVEAIAEKIPVGIITPLEIDI